MPDRDHDVSGMTAAELERARRDLAVSLALAFPGSPVRVPILDQMSAIDAELERRAGWDCKPRSEDSPRYGHGGGGRGPRGAWRLPLGNLIPRR